MNDIGRFPPRPPQALDSRRSAYFLAYGPNSAGKTYAMTGGSKHFEARGLIPRTLSYLFQRHSGSAPLQKAAAGAAPEAPLASAPTISVSFFEIYQDTVRDLLTPDRRVVSLTETEEGVRMDLIEKQVGETHGPKHDLFVHEDLLSAVDDLDGQEKILNRVPPPRVVVQPPTTARQESNLLVPPPSP